MRDAASPSVTWAIWAPGRIVLPLRERLGPGTYVVSLAQAGKRASRKGIILE